MNCLPLLLWGKTLSDDVRNIASKLYWRRHGEPHEVSAPRCALRADQRRHLEELTFWSAKLHALCPDPIEPSEGHLAGREHPRQRISDYVGECSHGSDSACIKARFVACEAGRRSLGRPIYSVGLDH